MTVWPDPQPDPEVEPGEDAETQLLPNMERLRAMTREQRDDLRDRVADWVGPLVEQFRVCICVPDQRQPGIKLFGYRDRLRLFINYKIHLHDIFFQAPAKSSLITIIRYSSASTLSSRL